MIEERARVVQVEGDYAWVETHRRSGCASCSEQKGCGTATLGSVFSTKPLRVRAQNRIGAAPGDSVVVGLQDAALVRSSMAIYLLPLLALLGGAIVARLAGGGEGISALGGIAGLAIGFWVVSCFSRRAAENPLYQAVVLRLSENVMQTAPVSFVKK